MTSTNSTVDATFRFGENGKLNLAAYKVSETRDGKKLNYTIVNNTLASPLARVVQSELQKAYFPFYSEYTYIKNMEGEYAVGKLADEKNHFNLARIMQGAGNYKYLSGRFTSSEYNMSSYGLYLKELGK